MGKATPVTVSITIYDVSTEPHTQQKKKKKNRMGWNEIPE